MKDHNSNKFKGIVRGFFHQLLMVDIVRHIIAKIRFFWFVNIRRKLKTFDLESNSVSPHTISHNKKGLTDLAVVRSLSIIRPLVAIEKLGIDSRVLTVGPRTEGEIFSLIGYGFTPNKIRGLDLISYSPWIDLGDMHSMPYSDNSWDVVVLGWVLAYSENREKAASEVARVLINGGIVSLGVEYNPLSPEDMLEKNGYLAGSSNRILSTDQILSYFGDSVGQVYYRHDIEEDRLDKQGSICVVFSIRKQNTSLP